MTEFRLRTELPDEAMLAMKGRNPTEAEFDLLLTGPTRVLKPDGQLLCQYLPGIIPQELREASYPVLHALKSFQTTNRSYASASKRVRQYRGTRTYSRPVSSAIVGAFDAKPPYQFCRLTSWTGTETEAFKSLWPFFREVDRHFREQVPDRYDNQEQFMAGVDPAWKIPNTAFSTATINNTYSTGVHTDAGDLPEGFGNLATLRLGKYSGGYLVFPQYRVGIDMKDGDVLLMDVHSWHGNTPLHLEDEEAERISVVLYVRRKLDRCGNAEQEAAKAHRTAEKRTQKEFASPGLPRNVMPGHAPPG